jgi:hypothetical protein
MSAKLGSLPWPKELVGVAAQDFNQTSERQAGMGCFVLSFF